MLKFYISEIISERIVHDYFWKMFLQGHWVHPQVKAKTHYTSFPVDSNWQVRNKLATSRSLLLHAGPWREQKWQKSPVSVVTWRFQNSITTSQQTCCQLVTDLLATRRTIWTCEASCRVAKKSWQQVSNFPAFYREATGKRVWWICSLGLPGASYACRSRRRDL